jgi:hypothetical protein
VIEGVPLPTDDENASEPGRGPLGAAPPHAASYSGWTSRSGLEVRLLEQSQSGAPHLVPFAPKVRGFERAWWDDRIPLLSGQSAEHYSFFEGGREVVRVIVHLNAHASSDYGVDPREQFSEILRIEVPRDLWRQGYGERAVDEIMRRHRDHRLFALSHDDESDNFWRGIRWAEHHRTDASDAAPMFVSPRH